MRPIPSFFKISLFAFGVMIASAHAMEDPSSQPSLTQMFEKAKPYLNVKNPLLGVQIYQEEQMGSSPQSIAKLHRSSYDLTGVSYFARSQVKEGLEFLSGAMVCDFLQKSMDLGKRYDLEDVVSFYVCQQGKAIKVAIMKPIYPTHLAAQMLHETNLTTPLRDYGHDLEALLKKYNGDVFKNDRIHLVREQLEETKKILLDDIEKLHHRGNDLEDLMERTTQLKVDAERFRGRAREMNSCCWLF